jgi:sterol desaturase/sphingolipid hydroxylase (fatty acid hydroxylase superfamily)
MLAAQLPAFGVVIALERLAPHHADWNRNHGDLGVDVGHLVTISLVSGLADPLLRFVGVGVAIWLFGEGALGLWPDEWPLLAQLPLALVIGELGQYWVHRLEHEKDWLWRFHALHHSAPRLYWLNAARFHPVDILLNNFAATVPLAALGAGLEVLSLWVLVSAIHGIFQHANMPVRIGPLNWVFSMAELHRWHHSKTLREANTNYGQNLIVWDVVFGTRFLPSDREPPREIGIADLPGYPMTWLAQELAPLRWSAIKAAGRSPVPPSEGVAAPR